MSDRPRRRQVPTITPPSFDDERPTSATSTTPAMAMDPEPPTLPAISITAPSFAEAAKMGPPRPKVEREGDARTVAGRTIPSAGAAPAQAAKRARPDPETRTEIAGLMAENGDPPPAAAPPQVSQRQEREPEPASELEPELENKLTEIADPWEYKGQTPAAAAALAADYDSGGVELDTSGRLVAPGAKPVRPRKREESDPGVSPADLLSVALEVWPDEPPQRPAALPRVEPMVAPPPRLTSLPPRVEPMVAPPPRPAGPPPRMEPVVAPPPRPGPPPRMETVETLPPREEPVETSSPREPLPASRELVRHPTPRAPVLKPSALAHADTVLRAPRSTPDPDAGWFEEPAGDRPPHRHARQEPVADERHDEEPRDERYDEEPRDERYDDEPLDEGYDDEPLDEETRIKGAMGRPRGRSRNHRRGGSNWVSAFLKLVLLGGAATGIWLWYTSR